MPIAGNDLSIIDVTRAAARDDVVAAMRSFYERADRLIAAQGATCWNRGDCCRFAQYGHRLYVTALEVACYLAGGALGVPESADACPHAVDGKCHVRDRRPLGCRVFYCDPAAQHWQGPLTETLLAELRSMHDQLSVPYFYADWMVVLRTLHRGEVNLPSVNLDSRPPRPPLVPLGLAGDRSRGST